MPANKTPSDGRRTPVQRSDAQRAAAAKRLAARADTTSTPAAPATEPLPGEAASGTAAPRKSAPATASPTKAAPVKAAGPAKAAPTKAAAKAAPTKAPAKAAAPEPVVPKTTATKAAVTTSAAAATKTPATKTTATKTGPAKAGGGRPASKPAGRPTGNRASAARAARTAAAGQSKKRPKSLVVKRRTPWGLIITCALVVVFAAAVIGYAVSRPKKISADDAPYVRNEIAAAKAIDGMLFKKHIQHTHITTLQKYDTSPPTGGNHSQVWADCTGTVYTKQIANENAVHPLEHGAVWITYRPGLDAASVATLAKLVTGVNYMFMTPYAGLKTPISLQAWNYQLFVNSATDPRIKAFIKALRDNPGTQPENASCSNPSFKTTPSTPGHPIWQ